MSGSASGGNAYTQAANGMTQAGAMTQAAGAYKPMQVGAGQLSSTSLTPYMNPYTKNVIDTSMGDLNRARTMAMNDVGASATSAGAFGGSRHGVAEGVTLMRSPERGCGRTPTRTPKGRRSSTSPTS